MVTLDKLRAMALALPEVEQEAAYHLPAFRVHGKLIALVREDGFSLALYATPADRAALPQIDPRTFSVPAHYATSKLFVVNLKRVRTAELRGLLASAWRMRAPKRLIQRTTDH